MLVMLPADKLAVLTISRVIAKVSFRCFVVLSLLI